MSKPLPSFLLAVLLSCFLGACGGGSGTDDGGGSAGGDGGPTGPNATFNGNYSIMMFGASQTLMTSTATHGFATATGTGTYTTSAVTSTDGTLGPVTNTPAAPYAVAVDGSVTFTGGILAGFEGGASSDGRLIIAALLSGTFPKVAILMRRTGTYSNANFMGDYHFGYVSAHFVPMTPRRISVWSGPSGVVMTGGAGAATFSSMSQNTSGTQLTAPGGMTAYAIGSDGRFEHSTIDAVGVGAITTGGSFAVSAGSRDAAEPPDLDVFVRRGTGMSVASFSGSYWAVAIRSLPSSSDQWQSAFGTYNADGMGGYDSNLNQNREGVFTIGGGISAYAVSALGQLTIGGLRGGLTQDGDYGYLCGSEFPGGGPELVILIRK